MKDLSTLFAESDRKPAGSSSAGALRDLVGPREENAPSRIPTRSRELNDLFGVELGAADASGGASSPADTAPAPAGAASEDTGRLAELVGTADKARRIPRASAGPEWLSPDQATAGRRPLLDATRRGRVGNWLSVGLAVLAAVALVAVVGLAVVQRATSNPAVEAMVSLREREAELNNDLQTLRTAAGFYDDAVAEAIRLSELATPVFASLEGQMDAGPLQAAEAQRVRLASAVVNPQKVTIPEYERPRINESSLASVGKGLDAVRKVRDGIPALLAEVRDARSSLAQVLSDFRTSLRAMGANIESVAASQIEPNDSADEGFRAAVQDAVNGLRQAQLGGSDGLAEMSTYSAALSTLRAENARVREELGVSSPPTTGTRSAGSSRGGQTTTPPATPGNGQDPGGQGGEGATPDPGGSSGGSTPQPSPSDSSPGLPVDPTTPPVDGLPTPGATG
ncbi:hypothetical protein [Microbacterium sp. B19]|uniref:hypothetical protein n=1 Tax=Microbacterium sp. B19 TaxID=96765 RepID=UPI0003B76C09|nr:hypothetical protein [Microbacterium sp. B19]